MHSVAVRFKENLLIRKHSVVGWCAPFRSTYEHFASYLAPVEFQRLQMLFAAENTILNFSFSFAVGRRSFVAQIVIWKWEKRSRRRSRAMRWCSQTIPYVLHNVQCTCQRRHDDAGESQPMKDTRRKKTTKNTISIFCCGCSVDTTAKLLWDEIFFRFFFGSLSPT